MPTNFEDTGSSQNNILLLRARSRRTKGLSSFLCAAPLLATSLAAGCGDSRSVYSTAPTTQQVVEVSGTQMTLDGHPWRSRGVVLQGFVRPLALLQKQAPTDTQAANILNARINYGTAELSAISAYHADTIRFQVSQPSLDPSSSLYDPQYLQDLLSAIKQARAAGFVVLVMMQDETITGDTAQAPLPTLQTQGDWDLLTAALGSDRGVIFELYNEPGLVASDANWQLWLNGGEYKGRAYIGMQTLADHIRSIGALNVLVVDGLGVEATGPSYHGMAPVFEASTTLQDVPIVDDALKRVVYAVHPYQHGLSNESLWDQEFGNPSTMLPVWADEWSAPTQLALGLGTLPDFQIAIDFVNYAQAHSIPICTGAFDVTRFVVSSVAPWTYNNYDNYSFTSTTDGSGTLVYNAFLNNYAKQLARTDAQ